MSDRDKALPQCREVKMPILKGTLKFFLITDCVAKTANNKELV